MRTSNSDKYIGKNFELFPLEWDTNYFNIPSARINLYGNIDLESQEFIIEYCSKYKFSTIFNFDNLKENNFWIGNRTKSFLTDINVQYSKNTIAYPKFPINNLDTFNNYKEDINIINIAKNSFHYSRFFNDPYLPKNKSNNIYSYWCKCSFDKKSKYFVVSKTENVTSGFILFSISQESKTAVIELFAVDKLFRGKKVGTSLLQKMESIVYYKGIKKINVGTQSDNIMANQFYTSLGFKYTSCKTIYHLWNN